MIYDEYEAVGGMTIRTTNRTWFDLGSNPGRRGRKPATDRLCYGTAFIQWVPGALPSYEMQVVVVSLSHDMAAVLGPGPIWRGEHPRHL
jgi:hypothetical protein